MLFYSASIYYTIESIKEYKKNQSHTWLSPQIKKKTNTANQQWMLSSAEIKHKNDKNYFRILVFKTNKESTYCCKHSTFSKRDLTNDRKMNG